jgi:GNAT superfamily N-acetyltransferase
MIEPSSDRTDVTLFAPKVRLASTADSQFDAMMTWRAELDMAYLDDGDTPDVLAGYADFLTIRIGEHPITELLDSLSQDAEHFAGLFDDDDVNDAVQEQFYSAMPFNRILIITMVFVAEPLRGRDLGAWLVSEVIARMAGATDTLVLLYPFPAVTQTGDASELAAVNALASYWRRVGLVPIDAHPEFVGQSTAYVMLPEARRALTTVEDVQVSVPASRIRTEQPRQIEPRHTLIGGSIESLEEYPWVVWSVTVTDPDRIAGADVSERTIAAAKAAADTYGCVYEYCVDDDEFPDGTKYYSWIIGVRQAEHRRLIGNAPVVVAELVGRLMAVLPRGLDVDQHWTAGPDLYATQQRNNVYQGYPDHQ